MWIRELDLQLSDRDAVRQGWLNDRIIDAVNTLVGRQIGVEHQSTLMAQSSSGFNTQTADTVMILHARQHWVTVSTTEDKIIYVDSLRPHQPISLYVISQLLTLFPNHIDDDGKLRMEIVPSTPQTNGEDCGVFAAAYATELICGDGIQGLLVPFDVASMRGHLESCLEQQELTPFPKMTARRTRQRRKVVKVAVADAAAKTPQSSPFVWGGLGTRGRRGNVVTAFCDGVAGHSYIMRITA